MSKLDPRPESNGNLYSWDRLNFILQSKFNEPRDNTATIDVRDYEMSKDEIITEAEIQGYKVTEPAENHLKFE